MENLANAGKKTLKIICFNSEKHIFANGKLQMQRKIVDSFYEIKKCGKMKPKKAINRYFVRKAE